MKIRFHIPFAALAAFLLSGHSLSAADHTIIEEGIPLELESAYPIAYGSFEFQGYGRFELTADDENVYRLVPRFEVGIFPNAQIAFEAPVELGSAVKQDGVRDLRLSGLYNINTESVWLPALSLVAGADFPTGPESYGVDPFGTVILQKTIGTSSMMHRVYVNLHGLINTNALPDERHALYKLVVGYSVRLGADTILLTDYVHEQDRSADKTINLAEIGIRRQITPRLVLAAGVGAGLDRDSPAFRATVGFQFTPGVPWFGRGDYGISDYSK